MKRTALLHAKRAHGIAIRGDSDMLVCADVGLPIPNDPRRVDLTITPGISAVTEVLRWCWKKCRSKRP